LSGRVPALAGRTIRCLLFDCGETLWTRREKPLLHALDQAAGWRALALLYMHFDPQDYPFAATLTGEQLRKAVDSYVRKLSRQLPEHEPNFAIATAEALRQLGFPGADPVLGAEIFEALRIRSCEARRLFPDALSTLDELRRRGFLLGIVTNRQYGGAPFREDLQTFGLLDYFNYDHVAVSADAGIRKPNPALFQQALDALGVPPEEAAMVGDSLHADVGGAQQLNLFTIWKPRLRLRAEARQSLFLDGGQLTDEYLLDYAHMLDNEKARKRSEGITPDLIIEHLSDLLTIFDEAGVQ
jgi:HAD superfamily hydrolase (TIGR01549 family)